MFCPKCGSLLVPKMEKGKKVLHCTCGYSDKDVSSAVIKEEVKQEEEIAVIEDADSQALPEVDAECPKCKAPKAYFWSVQTRASDEPETRFYRCVTCKHTWRDYS